MRRHVPAFALAISAALLAGCAKSTAGQPTPVSPAPASSTGSGAPRVQSALSYDHYVQAPCDALTQAQIDSFLGTGSEMTSEPYDPGGSLCSWELIDGSHAGITVIFGTTGKGLDRVYRGRGIDFLLFEPRPDILGYPAVVYGLTDERTTHGDCTVEIGTSDTSSIDVGATIREQNIGKKDPCEAAYQAATTIMGNIRGGH